MKIRFSALFLVAIVLSMAIVAQIDFIQTADAVKSKGTKTMKYGMATKDKVCGDRLCTPEDFASTGEPKSLPALTDSPITSQMAMDKMERLFELHRIQLVSVWDSLADSEKSNLMTMFDRIYEKMQSMSITDHMKHMSKMMDGKHHDSMKGEHDMKGCPCGDMKHGMSCDCAEDGTCSCGAECSCGDMKHGCSCGDSEHGMACEAGSEGCMCSEDGVCNCGEGCTCASCH